MTCDGAAGSFLLAYAGHEGCISLQLTIDLQLGTALLGQTGGLNDLIDHLVLGRALGGEAQHGYAGIVEAGDTLGGLRGADGNLCQLVGIGHGRHGHVAHDEDTVLTVFGFVGNQEHGAADAGDTR